MAFNSPAFLLFFPVVVTLYFVAPHRVRWSVLLVASYFFYMYWKPVYGLLLLSVTVIAYVTAIAIEHAPTKREKRHQLTACLVILLGLLFVFKYFNFFNGNLRTVFTAVGSPYPFGNLSLLLPLGISFFTFQKIGYVVDVYQGRVKAERHLGYFALFGAFFPQLVAGPIERAGNLLPQMRRSFDFDYRRVSNGLKLMGWGFFKKVCVADRLAPFVNNVYGQPQEHDAAALMLATFFFAIQIYCDFSGYTDIAIGAAHVMGYKLTMNFRTPYFATSIADFWKRWHISLSTWLTDYVYTPLTRSRLLRMKWYPKFLLSLLLTFLVSGLWHGAAWTYIVWGGLHGVYLVSSVITRDVRERLVASLRLDRVPRVHAALRMTFTFFLVCVGYVFFRAATLGDAWYILSSMAAGSGRILSAWPARLGEAMLDDGGLAVGVAGLAVIVVVSVLEVRGGVMARMARWPAWQRWAVYYVLVVAIVIAGAAPDDRKDFIYFRF
ncbi:MAG TPA: MBOAT family O-acyltransferase [Methylomirabilota bacterium]|nr:MBOAT family O-acyltransferase [Methylomirabilota bacterium]